MSEITRAEDTLIFSSLLSSESYAPQAEQTMGNRSGPARRRRMNRPKEGPEEAAGESKKRRLSGEQVRLLEMSFGSERKLESGRKAHLASELGLDPKQVAVWFQNRRARWKSKQLEEEYLRLKSAHDGVVVQKCHLEAQVLKLKEQLAEAQKEITKLSASGSSIDAVSCGGSPSSSFSMEPRRPPLPGPNLCALGAAAAAAAAAAADLTYVHDYGSYVNNMMEWTMDHFF